MYFVHEGSGVFTFLDIFVTFFLGHTRIFDGDGSVGCVESHSSGTTWIALSPSYSTTAKVGCMMTKLMVLVVEFS